MTRDKYFVKKIVAVVFLAVLAFSFLKSGSWQAVATFVAYLQQSASGGEGPLTLDVIETSFAGDVWKHNELINLNGYLANKLNQHGQYSDMGLYVIGDCYIVTTSPETSTDYETEQTVAFRDFLEANGVNLLYVNEPTKYVDDSIFLQEFGIESYSNRNMDLFLKRLRAAGVNAVDLRECMEAEGISVYDMFYRTDHHWTVPAALWATGKIAEGLNTYCGYNTDLSYFDEQNFNRTDYPEALLGEQGRLLAQTYTGLDDYTELKPAYETAYTFKAGDGSTYEGTFDNFVDESFYNLENDVYETPLWHYSYLHLNCINNNVESGKVLLVGDSYDNLTHAFLSLQVHEVDFICLRNIPEDFSLRDYILENGYDTVVVAYAQFMVGAHDDPTSANYCMFGFDQ
jgi:hypothetical protein